MIFKRSATPCQMIGFLSGAMRHGAFDGIPSASFSAAQRMNETELVIEMQARLMNLTPESYGETLKFICDSVDRNHPDRAFMVETNIMGAVEYRPKSISELARLSKDFAIFLAGSTELEKIQQVHKLFFVNPVVYFNSAFALFSRNCVENGLISAEYFVHLMREFRKEHSESVYEYLTFFSWFCPEIEKYDQELYDEILQFFKKKGQMPNLLSSLKIVIDNFDELRANEWQKHKEVVKSNVGTEPIAQALLHDNVEQLKKLMEEPGFDINMRMKPNVFCFTKFLQRYPTLVQFCGFLGSEKCFKVLLDAGADVNLKDRYRSTPIFTAVLHAPPHIIHMMLQQTTDINIVSNDGHTVLQFLIWRYMDAYSRYSSAQYIQLIKEVLDKGAALDNFDKFMGENNESPEHVEKVNELRQYVQRYLEQKSELHNSIQAEEYEYEL